MKRGIASILVMLLLITGCKQVDVGKGYIAGKPIPSAEQKITVQARKTKDELLDKIQNFRDFSCADVSDVDFQLEMAQYMIMHTIFDSRTIWSDRLPENFKPEELLETEKNAGWHIKEVHERGIDGTGVNIGIIDQTFLMDHEAFGDQIQFYKQGKAIKSYQVGEWSTQYISKLIGKKTGIAPNAHLYFIADFPSIENRETKEITFDVSGFGEDIGELLRINETLSEEDKLDMIILPQIDFGEHTRNSSNVNAAIAQAEKQGIMVITRVHERTNKNYYHTITKTAYTKGEQLEDYKESISRYNRVPTIAGMPSLFLPMGGFTFASGIGVHDYEYNPVINEDINSFIRAGYYALALQCNPSLTRDEIDQIMYETSTTIELDTMTSFPIVDVIAMIDRIQEDIA